MTVYRMHDLLLHLAGRVPDDFLASARQQLTEESVTGIADAVCLQLAERKVPVNIAQAGLLSELVGDEASAVFGGIPIRDEQPPLEWMFAESPAPSGVLGQSDSAAGKAERPETPGRSETGDATDALIDVLSGESTARGLWLSWRTPFRGGGPPLPVHVVEAGDGLAALSAQLHQALAERPGTPRIEVVGTGEVPGYQRAARAYGALVWAATEPPELSVARVFDRVDPDGGPQFDRDHPRLTDQGEFQRVLDYLRAGEVLLSTGATMDDVVQRERGQVVPTSYRTDGVWLWPDAVTYYLQEHGLAPDERFLAHIRAAEGPPDQLDAVSTHRALRQLLDPST